MTVNYQSLLEESMLDIIRKILLDLQGEGEISKNNQSIYISFCTDYPQIILSDRTKKLYPKEMTIVLQHQFRDLQIQKDYFSVIISFNGVEEMIQIPFSALTAFSMPDINFNLQFRKTVDNEESEKQEITSAYLSTPCSKKQIASNEAEQKLGKIIAINKFRKKK